MEVWRFKLFTLNTILNVFLEEMQSHAAHCFHPRWPKYVTDVPQNYNDAEKVQQPSDPEAVMTSRHIVNTPAALPVVDKYCASCCHWTSSVCRRVQMHKYSALCHSCLEYSVEQRAVQACLSPRSKRPSQGGWAWSGLDHPGSCRCTL